MKSILNFDAQSRLKLIIFLPAILSCQQSDTREGSPEAIEAFRPPLDAPTYASTFEEEACLSNQCGNVRIETLWRSKNGYEPQIKNTPKGSRTPVTWMRTMYPRPLDDGGLNSCRRSKKGIIDDETTRNSGGRSRTFDLRLMNPAL